MYNNIDLSIPYWTFNNKEMSNLEHFSDDSVGFIYLITLSNGKSYIGRKKLYSERKRNFGKKELANIVDKRKKKYEIIKKESDWNSYIGSNKLLHEDFKNGIRITKREILKICNNEKQMTYFETYYLFLEDVLNKNEYYNDNILGKFYRKDLNNG